jgi:hypothetical protein
MQHAIDLKADGRHAHQHRPLLCQKDYMNGLKEAELIEPLTVQKLNAAVLNLPKVESARWTDMFPESAILNPLSLK